MDASVPDVARTAYSSDPIIAMCAMVGTQGLLPLRSALPGQISRRNCRAEHLPFREHDDILAGCAAKFLGEPIVDARAGQKKTKDRAASLRNLAAAWYTPVEVAINPLGR